jgi:hypothetical protein
MATKNLQEGVPISLVKALVIGGPEEIGLRLDPIVQQTPDSGYPIKSLNGMAK